MGDEDEAEDDGGTFSIRLMNEDGDPISNRKITVFLRGTLLPGLTLKEYTDSDGWAEFKTYGYTLTSEIYTDELNDDLLVTSHSELLSAGEEIYDGATFSFTIRA